MVQVLIGFPKRKALRILAVFQLALLGTLVAADKESGSADPHPHVHLKVVCSTSLFRNVDRAQVVATSKAWLEKIGTHNGWVMDTEIELADSVDAIRKRTDEGSIDLVVTSTLEYLALDRPKLLKPEMTMTAGAEGKIKYLLVVSRDSGFSQVEDLKGKTLLAYSHADPILSRMWMDVMLQGRRLGPLDQFFRSYASSPKPSAACLPLFFGKADACLIDDASWQTLQDLNPQVGTKLKIIAQSPALVESLVSVHVNRKEYRADLIHNMLRLQDDPEGRQILLFFKTQRAVAITASDLTEVVDLRSNYSKLPTAKDHKANALVALPARDAAPETTKAH